MPPGRYSIDSGLVGERSHRPATMAPARHAGVLGSKWYAAAAAAPPPSSFVAGGGGEYDAVIRIVDVVGELMRISTTRAAAHLLPPPVVGGGGDVAPRGGLGVTATARQILREGVGTAPDALPRDADGFLRGAGDDAPPRANHPVRRVVHRRVRGSRLDVPLRGAGDARADPTDVVRTPPPAAAAAAAAILGRILDYRR